MFNVNIGLLLLKSVKTYPEKSAIVYGDKILTYNDFNERVNRLANALLALGVSPGENVAIMQWNCPQLLESMFACFKTGFGAVPINARLHSKEFSYIIQHSKSKAVIFGKEFNETIKSIRNEISNAQHLICLSNPEKEMLDYEKILSEHSSKWELSTTDSDDLAWLFYTSGTTGRPKGAMLTHRNLLVQTMNFYADLYPLQPEDKIFHLAPLTHGSGLYAIPALAKGATNIISKSRHFDPKLIFETIEEKGVTVIPFLTPTMIKMLMNSTEINNNDLSSLKAIIYGGAPMYVEDLKEAVKKLGRIFVQLYGQGEAPMTITYLRKEEHLIEGTKEQLDRLASAGIARTDVEVKIFDENEHELPSNNVGEIVVRGDIVMKGYFQNPKATAETIKDGWLHTGDLGYMDEKGYLFLKDRKNDVIISGGANIYSREVEDAILFHPAVHKIAVVGMPDPLWGESVKAFIVLKEGISITEQEITNFCKEHIASYKKPKSVEFVKELPTSAYGKTLKRKLRGK